jgi:hypothetical protein
VTRPLIISILLVSIIFLCLKCVRRRRAIMAYQEQALREHEAAELGAASGSQFYMHQYAPPPGAPLPMGSTYNPHSHRRSSYHPSLYVPPQHPSTSATITTTTFEESRQNGATLGSTYIPAQDANADDLPSVPPPPYTPQVPK